MLAVEIALNAIGQEVTDRLRQDIKNKSLVNGYPPPNAAGKLHDSIRYEVDGSTLKVYAEDYIYYLQYGRKPGKFPPITKIRQWVGQKLGITDERERNSIAYLIGRKIANEGTLIYRQGGSNLLTDIINTESISRWQKEISFYLVSEIQSDIIKIAA